MEARFVHHGVFARYGQRKLLLEEICQRPKDETDLPVGELISLAVVAQNGE